MRQEQFASEAIHLSRCLSSSPLPPPSFHSLCSCRRSLPSECKHSKLIPHSGHLYLQAIDSTGDILSPCHLVTDSSHSNLKKMGHFEYSAAANFFPSLSLFYYITLYCFLHRTYLSCTLTHFVFCLPTREPKDITIM